MFAPSGKRAAALARLARDALERRPAARANALASRLLRTRVVAPGPTHVDATRGLHVASAAAVRALIPSAAAAAVGSPTAVCARAAVDVVRAELLLARRSLAHASRSSRDEAGD